MGRTGWSGVRSVDGDKAKDMDKDTGRARASAVRAGTRVTEDGTRGTGRRAKGQECTRAGVGSREGTQG